MSRNIFVIVVPCFKLFYALFGTEIGNFVYYPDWYDEYGALIYHLDAHEQDNKLNFFVRILHCIEALVIGMWNPANIVLLTCLSSFFMSFTLLELR